MVYGYKKEIIFYVQSNQAEYNDNVFQYSPDGTQKDLISVNRVDQDLLDSSDEVLTSIYFVKDYEYVKYSRNVFSLLEMFGNIGGLFEILEVSGSLLVGCFASHLFDYSIVSTFYQVDTTNQDDDIDKDESKQNESRVNQDNEQFTDKGVIEEYKTNTKLYSNPKVENHPSNDLSIIKDENKSK